MDEKFRLSLGEGNTPVESLAIGDDGSVWLKREDLQPSGSHKARAACLQLALAAQSGDPAVTISSSGNAAIATSMYAALQGVDAYVFMHPDTDVGKTAAIDGRKTTVVMTPRAINSAKKLARAWRITNLRPSVNDDAVIAYKTLAAELVEPIRQNNIQAIVLFATSGATALAVADYFLNDVELETIPQVHFVQGEGNAALVNPESQITDASAHKAAAGRLGIRHSRRARALREAIEATGGRGHAVAAGDVDRMREVFRAKGIDDVGNESCANLAVALELADQGLNVISVVSGAPPVAAEVSARVIEALDEHEALVEIDALAGKQ